MATVSLSAQTARLETKLSCREVDKMRWTKFWLPTTWCQNIILPLVSPNIPLSWEHQAFSPSFLNFVKFTFESQLRILWHLLATHLTSYCSDDTTHVTSATFYHPIGHNKLSSHWLKWSTILCCHWRRNADLELEYSAIWVSTLELDGHVYCSNITDTTLLKLLSNKQ